MSSRILKMALVLMGLAAVLILQGVGPAYAADPPPPGTPVLGGNQPHRAPRVTSAQEQAIKPVPGKTARHTASRPETNSIARPAGKPVLGGNNRLAGAKAGANAAPETTTRGGGPVPGGDQDMKPPTQRSASAEATTWGAVAYYAWTYDVNGTPKNSFNVGDAIRYGGQIYNSTGGTQTAYVQWYRQTPCGSGYLWQGNLTVPAGYPWWYIEATADCPGTHTYTFYVTFNGSTTAQSATYTVKGGSVTAYDAWTQNTSGLWQDTFKLGDTVRYAGQAYNTTGATQTAYVQWYRQTACGSGYVWQGNMSVPAGYPWWYVEATANCTGTQTFTFYVTFNGVTTSDTATYNVTGGTVTASDAWTMDANNADANSFKVGAKIHFGGEIYNNTGATQTAYVQWYRQTPCGASYIWQGNLSVPNGYPWWWYEATAECPGTHTYTFSVTYNGSTTSKSASYTVTGGQVTAYDAWTTDTNGTEDNSFNEGQMIRYVGQIYNATGASQTAYVEWYRQTPCGSGYLWQGNLAVPNGYPWWFVEGTASCPGTHTLKFFVTFNGVKTSQSYTYAVNAVKPAGIDYHTRKSNGVNVHILKIDMTSPNLSFETVMANDVNNVNPPSKQREYVSHMVGRAPYSGRNPVAAFNADYFSLLSGDNHGPEGLTVKNGARIDGYASNPDDTDGNEWKRSSLSISKNKALRIGKETDCTGDCVNWIPNPDAYRNTVGGGPLFIENGQRIGGVLSTLPCKNENKIPLGYCKNYMAWTAAGMTADGRYLIVAVGKQQNMDTMAAVLIAEGASRAIKLDGKCSTQLWYNGASIIAGCRPVADAILVFSQ